MSTAHCVLLAFDASCNLDACGNLIGGKSINASSHDATAIFYVTKTDIQSMFKYFTNDADLHSDSSTIQYYTYATASDNSSNSMYNLQNVANGMMYDVSYSSTTISNFDSHGRSFADDKSLLKHDYVRYLAKSIFNTEYGTDFFSNQSEILDSIDRACNTNAWSVYNSVIQNVCTTNTGLYYDASADAHYTTDDLSGNSNLCRELFLQLMNADPFRFFDASAGVHGLPFNNGDTISLSLSLHAAADQEYIVSPPCVPVPKRTYEIKLIVGDTPNTVPTPNQ
jgi:hypothetical protein